MEAVMTRAVTPLASTSVRRRHAGRLWCRLSRPAAAVKVAMSTDPGRAPEPVQSLRLEVLQALHDQPGETVPLEQVGRACLDLLPVTGASIAVMTADTQNREVLYASDEAIAAVEELQFSLGEGPCYQAFHTGSPVLVPDLAAEAATSWPVFAHETTTHPGSRDVAAVFAFPLRSGAVSIGALDLYRTEPGWLTDEQVSTALQLVDLAGVTLLGIHLGGESADELSGLPHGRAEVHQATGMLIAAWQISPTEALARLRAAAYATGRFVNDVALDLVNRHIAPTDLER